MRLNVWRSVEAVHEHQRRRAGQLPVERVELQPIDGTNRWIGGVVVDMALRSGQAGVGAIVADPAAL